MSVITDCDLVNTFQAFEIDPTTPLIAHASLSAFGKVNRGSEAMVGALLAVFTSILMPSFTYNCMVTPEIDPPNNGLHSGDQRDRNQLAEIYHPDMPVDPLMGIIPETLRKHPNAQRSYHPLQSFGGVNTERPLDAQSLKEPWLQSGPFTNKMVGRC